MVLELLNVRLEELIHRIRFSWNIPPDTNYDEIRIYYTIYDGTDFNNYISIDKSLTIVDIGIMGYDDPEPNDNIPLYNNSILDGIVYNFKVVGVINNLESDGPILKGNAISGYKLYISHDDTQTVLEFNDIDQITEIVGNNFVVSGLTLGTIYNFKVTSYVTTIDNNIIESDIDLTNIKYVLAYPRPIISFIIQQNGYVYIYFPEVIAQGEETYLFYQRIFGTNNDYQLTTSVVTQISSNPNLFRAKITGLPLGTYNFTLKATSQYGISESSDEISGTVVDGLKPRILSLIDISNLTHNSLTVLWTDNQYQLDDITQYIIYLYSNNILINTFSITPEKRSYIINGLQSKTKYNIFIGAVNSYGISDLINISGITRIDPIVISISGKIQGFDISMTRSLTNDEYLEVTYTLSGTTINKMKVFSNTQLYFVGGLYASSIYNININLKTTLNNINNIFEYSLKTLESKPSVLMLNVVKNNRIQLGLDYYINGITI